MEAALRRRQRVLGRQGLDPKPGRDHESLTWSGFFAAYEPVYAFVAEREGKLLALAHSLFHRSRTSVEPSCDLEALFRQGAARGKDVGRGLIEAVCTRARTAAAGRVY
jgi:GNAT superfamily N-acetyltransferase